MTRQVRLCSVIGRVAKVAILSHRGIKLTARPLPQIHQKRGTLSTQRLRSIRHAYPFCQFCLRGQKVLISGNLLTIQTKYGFLKAFWIPLAPVIGCQLDANVRLSRELPNQKFT